HRPDGKPSAIDLGAPDYLDGGGIRGVLPLWPKQGPETNGSHVKSSSRFLVILLALTLALSALLAYEAQRATPSHQVTADRALRDYATVAAWEFVTASEEQIDRALAAALGPVVSAPAVSPYDSLPPPTVLAASADSVFRCGNSEEARGRYFVLDFRTGM